MALSSDDPSKRPRFSASRPTQLRYRTGPCIPNLQPQETIDQINRGLATVTAPVPAAPSGPVTTVGDGTFEVGIDMVAGRYKTTGPVADSFAGICYLERANNDSGELN